MGRAGCRSKWAAHLNEFKLLSKEQLQSLTDNTDLHPDLPNMLSIGNRDDEGEAPKMPTSSRFHL